MKLKKYLTEDNKQNLISHNGMFLNDKYESLMDDILKNCNQWLKEGNGKPLYRGAYKISKPYGVLTPRSDRRPLDTPKPIHDYMDDWFKKKFGWKARTEGVFCSNDYTTASEYGSRIFAIYPFDGYKYIFDPKIEDLATHLSNNYVGYMAFGTTGTLKTINYDRKKTFGELLEIAMNKAKFTDKNIIKLLKSVDDAEIMLKCKHYYYIELD